MAKSGSRWPNCTMSDLPRKSAVEPVLVRDEPVRSLWRAAGVVASGPIVGQVRCFEFREPRLIQHLFLQVLIHVRGHEHSKPMRNLIVFAFATNGPILR